MQSFAFFLEAVLNIINIYILFSAASLELHGILKSKKSKIKKIVIFFVIKRGYYNTITCHRQLMYLDLFSSPLTRILMLLFLSCCFILFSIINLKIYQYICNWLCTMFQPYSQRLCETPNIVTVFLLLLSSTRSTITAQQIALVPLLILKITSHTFSSVNFFQ